MKLPTTLPLLSALAAALPAQQVYVSANAEAPMVVEASLSGNVVSNSQPAGPLPIFGIVQSRTPGFEAVSRVNWSSWASTQSAYFSLDAGAQASPVVGAIATSGEHTVLVYFSANTPLAADLELSATVSATAGTPSPLVRVDVYDDGISELAESWPTGTVPLTLGTVPVPVRIRVRAEAQPGAIVSVNVDVRLVPNNNLLVGTIVQGCTFDHLSATPSFLGTGIDFQVAASQVPNLLVLGLNAAPQALPPIGFLPCILLPHPDALILLTYSLQHKHVPIPLAVRPLQLFAQSAAITPNGEIGLSNGLMVSAY